MTGPRRKRWVLVAGAVCLTMWIAGYVYVKTHPLVFNESLWGHAHCIKQTGLAFRLYARDHGGRYPAHTNGYGDALLLMTNEISWWGCMTGPGYDDQVFRRARATGEDVPEEECGRVYVQGLREGCNPEIALFFDKLPTPGGDHCHFPTRLSAPLCREVVFADGSMQSRSENMWPAFAREQVELLITAGIPRETAEAYYREQPKPSLRR